jgi:hypothetical protein
MTISSGRNQGRPEERRMRVDVVVQRGRPMTTAAERDEVLPDGWCAAARRSHSGAR